MTWILRAPRFAILTSRTECHHCGRSIPVSALLVPTFRQFDGGDWVELDDSALLTYVEAVDERTELAWKLRAPWIRPAASKTAALTYLANVCECGALQGDWYLIRPDAPFFPLDEAGIAAIQVEWFEAPIEARASPSMSSWTDRLIARTPYLGWTPPPAVKPRRARRRS